jgi:SAM-dependent methyltransferase
MSRNALYLPPAGTLPGEAAVRAWFANIAVELNEDSLDRDQKQALSSYYREAGLLRSARSAFFHAHYECSIATALRHLFGTGTTRPRILDLGCGLGTQSLLFALMGADVVAVDLDGNALEILGARAAFYGRHCGHPLAITRFQADTFSFDYGNHGPFDGIWSLFAFNMMQPSRELLNRILPHTAPGCRFAVMDGNRLHWGRWLREKPFSPIPSLTPLEFARELQVRDFRVTEQHSGIGLPPVAWTLLPFGLLRAVEKRLDRRWFFPVSHVILAEKAGGNL